MGCERALHKRGRNAAHLEACMAAWNWRACAPVVHVLLAHHARVLGQQESAPSPRPQCESPPPQAPNNNARRCAGCCGIAMLFAARVLMLVMAAVEPATCAESLRSRCAFIAVWLHCNLPASCAGVVAFRAVCRLARQYGDVSATAAESQAARTRLKAPGILHRTRGNPLHAHGTSQWWGSTGARILRSAGRQHSASR